MSPLPAFEIGIWNAWIFMSTFWLQMLAVMLFGKRAWERSSHPSDIKRSKLEALAGITGNTVWLSATLYSIFLPLKIGTLWFYIGLPIFLIGLTVLVITTVNFASPIMEKPATAGMYRFSRHPLYLSLLIIYIGTSVATASWVFLLLTSANIFWIRTEARVEEKYCLEKFGDSYLKYINNTPRWIGIPGKEIEN